MPSNNHPICTYTVFQRFGDGSRVIKLSEGSNRVEIEVVAEDGTIKKYFVEIIRLFAKIAELSDLALEGDIVLHPDFSTKIYDYTSEYKVITKKVDYKACHIAWLSW